MGTTNNNDSVTHLTGTPRPRRYPKRSTCAFAPWSQGPGLVANVRHGLLQSPRTLAEVLGGQQRRSKRCNRLGVLHLSM